MIFTWHSIPTALRALQRFSRSLFRRDEQSIASPYVRGVRDARCRLCPHYDAGQCRVCTCVVGLKTLFATEFCPDNPPRWRRETRTSTGL